MRKRDESKHFLVIGDSGVGKSQFIKQLIYYAHSLGESCVIHDPKREFIQEFYDPQRNDSILNPKDTRCPSWFVGKEIVDEAEALGLTRPLFPSHPSNPQAQFWDDYANRLSAYLLANSEQPLSCQELARLFTSEKEIFKRLRRTNTEYEQLFGPGGSSPMRTSVIQTLSTIGYALRMMPDIADAPAFTFREWIQSPTPPWLFLSNTTETREAVRPMQSAWADIAIKRAMSRPEGAPRIWIFLDELDSFHTLPVLTEAITMGRTANIILVIGFQNVSQLEDRYGKQANTIFSQAGTKVVLATSDGPSAKSLEELIGQEERRTVRQSRTAGMFGGRERDSYSGPEEAIKPRIMASEIQGLPDLRGYFLQRPNGKEIGLNIVDIKLPYLVPVKREPALIERLIPNIEIVEDYVDIEPETNEHWSAQPQPGSKTPVQAELIRLSNR